MNTVTLQGSHFTARWEGFRSCPYRDPVGVWTRGFGETKNITQNSRCVTRREARADLLDRLRHDFAVYIPWRRRMRRWEIDALADAAYNLGPGVVSDPDFSTLARRLISREGSTYRKRKRIYRQELPKWVYAGGVRYEGLVKRRAAEVRLACRGDYSGRP